MSSEESDDFESAGEETEEVKDSNTSRKKVSKEVATTKTEKETFSTPRKEKNIENNNPTEPKVSKEVIADDSGAAGGADEGTGWDDDDDWGEDFEVQPQAKAVEVEVAPKEEPKKDDDGNWSDFDDDWGTETDAASNSKGLTANNTTENAKRMFPVLDGISPAKEPARPSGFLSSLSNKTPTSNYQAFPVLNDLTAKTSPAAKLAEPPTQSPGPKEDSGWGWKPWGGTLSSIISTATEGVTSITSQVSQGFSTVIENSIGVPDPEEMARQNRERLQQSREASIEEKVDHEEDSTPSPRDENILPSFGNLMTGVTNIGNKVLTGGLDTLEGIGKKTMTILQENDPLLLNKRKMLGMEQNKPVLSQVLREAKEKSEEVEKNLKQMQKHSYKKQLHFESLFDNYYGLVHLEALEMLSKQSTMKLQSLLDPLSGKALVELQETLNEVKELCDLGDVENDEPESNYSTKDLQEKLEVAVEDLGIQIEFAEILKCWETNNTWLTDNESATAEEIYEKGLRCLAETCALAICKMHKISEMLLIKEHHSTANEADSLVQLTLAFCSHISAIANLFGSKLNSFEKTEEVSSLITSIFVEVYNSTTYIQNAFQLLIPILQIGAA